MDPYVVGDPVKDPARFYGREEVLSELLRSLEAGNHIAVYGERRIGKTSILHQLAGRLRQLQSPGVTYLPVFLNLQLIPENRFFYALASELAKASRARAKIETLLVDQRPERYDSLDMADDMDKVVVTLRRTEGKSPRIVLLLDEGDEMNSYDPHTQQALRGLLMTPTGGSIKLVWSGQSLSREWHLSTSPWYNLFKNELHLGGLEDADAIRLIPRAG